MVETKTIQTYLVIIVLLLISYQLTINSGFSIKEKYEEYLFGESADEDYKEIFPAAGYCTEKGYEVNYGTYLENGERVPIEYCRLERFCEYSEVSIALSSESFDEDKLNNFLDKHSDMACFTDTAVHSQRSYDIPEDESLKVKFACCTNEDPEEQSKCASNTCNGVYTGVRDEFNCRLYASYIEGEWRIDCGGGLVSAIRTEGY